MSQINTELLFRPHLTALRRYVSKFAPATAIDDIMKETSRIATERIHQGQGLKNPRALLYGIARILVLSTGEIKEVDTETAARALAEELESSPAPPPAISKRDFFLLCKAVAALPPQLKFTLILKKVYGLDMEDIAKECGVSVEIVRWRLTEAFKRVNKYLEKHN